MCASAKKTRRPHSATALQHQPSLTEIKAPRSARFLSFLSVSSMYTILATRKLKIDRGLPKSSSAAQQQHYTLCPCWITTAGCAAAATRGTAPLP